MRLNAAKPRVKGLRGKDRVAGAGRFRSGVNGMRPTEIDFDDDDLNCRITQRMSAEPSLSTGGGRRNALADLEIDDNAFTR